MLRNEQSAMFSYFSRSSVPFRLATPDQPKTPSSDLHSQPARPIAPRHIADRSHPGVPPSTTAKLEQSNSCPDISVPIPPTPCCAYPGILSTLPTPPDSLTCHLPSRPWPTTTTEDDRDTVRISVALLLSTGVASPDTSVEVASVPEPGPGPVPISGKRTTTMPTARDWGRGGSWGIP